MSIRGEFIGYDGLPNDETVSKYWADGDMVVEFVWGKQDRIEPQTALAELEAARTNTARAYLKTEQRIEAERLGEINKSIANLKRIFDL